MKNKIPKVINYCWFGGNELPEKAKKCIESWKKYCPDYEIVEWNEKNYDINKYEFTKKAYEEKKWAFVTDVARLDIIYNNGGIYFDTDVELIKNIDELLIYECFLGFESKEYINTGLGFGAIKGCELIKANLDMYEQIHFPKDNKAGKVSCPIITSKVLKKYGFNLNGKTQEKNGIKLFSPEYFCPLDYETKKLKITNNTYSIHWYEASWLTKFDKFKHNIKVKLKRWGLK